MDVWNFSSGRFLGAAAVAALAVGVGFAGGRVLLDDDSATAQQEGPSPAGQRTPPVDPEVMPAPGATPDTSQPLWYVPYLNRNRDLPEFDGEINGIKIHLRLRDGDPTPRHCDGKFEAISGEDAVERAVRAGLISSSIDIEGAIPSQNRPPMELCDGEPRFFQQLFSFPPGHPRTNRGGGSAEVWVLDGSDTAHIGAPEERWSEGQVRGFPAALLRPIVETPVEYTLDGSAVAVLREGPVLTVVTCAAASLGLCQDVAAEALP